MATFSTNQNRQLYVVAAVGTIGENSPAKTVEVKTTGNGVGKDLFFKYVGADTPMRSDIIPVKNIEYVKAVSADSLAVKLRQVKVTLDPNINSGNPVSGLDYILTIDMRQLYGMSDEDRYQKFGAVHVTAAMDAAGFYAKMAESLKMNFSREATKYFDFEAQADCLLVKEVELPWALGTFAQEQVSFDVNPGTIIADGEEVVWGVTQKTGDKKDSKGNAVADVLPEAALLNDGKKIADLEYFCMGERGDQYRNIGWPNVIPTKYLVDPSKAYHTLEIHYAFTDTGVNSYKSEKDITFVAEDKEVINALVTAINTATGLTVSTL